MSVRNVYLSFLGLGVGNPPDYKHAVYKMNNQVSSETKFVQAAELEILGPGKFDTILIAGTETSLKKHFPSLESELKTLGSPAPFQIQISENMEPRHQWQWFEKILEHIDPSDTLTVDMTHGFRAVPILFSSAINFMQKSKNIEIDAVYYGAFENRDEHGHAPIIDMKDFYLINEWAEGVSRLVEDADARKLAEVANKTPDFQIRELDDPELITAMEDLTNAVRDVDLNKIGVKANTALNLIQKKQTSASKTGHLLLGLIIDKFISLTSKDNEGMRYDEDYFRLQLSIARLLLEHKLFMQAFTVMREFIASMGMIPYEKEGMKNKKRKERRKLHAEIFLQMVLREKWEFPEKYQKIVNKLKPFHLQLEGIGVLVETQKFINELIKSRNGFDHGWTTCIRDPDTIARDGWTFHTRLENIMAMMEKNNILNY